MIFEWFSFASKLATLFAVGAILIASLCYGLAATMRARPRWVVPIPISNEWVDNGAQQFTGVVPKFINLALTFCIIAIILYLTTGAKPFPFW